MIVNSVGKVSNKQQHQTNLLLLNRMNAMNVEQCWWSETKLNKHWKRLWCSNEAETEYEKRQLWNLWYYENLLMLIDNFSRSFVEVIMIFLWFCNLFDWDWNLFYWRSLQLSYCATRRRWTIKLSYTIKLLRNQFLSDSILGLRRFR